MKKYLVGGIVRDMEMNTILGSNIQSKDRDWVVVGSTSEEMLQQGFSMVGSFPVFLHPETQEEYALARTERKSGKGYKGFNVDFSPTVTLEEDLERRDLTINAIAKDPETGEIIDPYGGREDIANKTLRHVSSAFVEDPLRVLRVARFAARFVGFDIAAETLREMQRIVNTGEIEYLTPERVWKEMLLSLEEGNPQVFFDTLRKCGALKEIWPDLDALWGIPNPEKWHPEICSGLHTMMVLKQTVLLSSKPTIRFAALCHDLGKGLTPKDDLPSHRGHENTGLALVEKACLTFRVPNEYKRLALKVCQFHLHCHKAFELKPSTILKLFNQLDVWRNPAEFEDFLVSCEADFKGRLNFENRLYPQADFLRAAAQAALKVNVKAFVEQGLKGRAIKEAIDLERIDVIKAFQKYNSRE